MSTALWKEIQSFVGIAADGIPGPTRRRTRSQPSSGSRSAPAPRRSTRAPRRTSPPWCRPRQAKAREWLARCRAEGINVKVICGLRSNAEQAALYAQGRTAPGPKVTNAKPGYSWHNFGVAWDFVVFDDRGQPLWDSPLMDRCGAIGEDLGLEWGGRWTNPQDKPHLQLKLGISLAEARQRVADGKWPGSGALLG